MELAATANSHVNRVDNRAGEASNSWGSSSLQSPLMGGSADQPHRATIHDASTRSADELHGDINTNMTAPSFSPVHFDEGKGPVNDVQTAEHRGMLNKDHCVIIQGLPESSVSTPRERVAADLEQFQKLLNEMLQPTEDVTVLKTFRLGSRTTAAPQTRPRPLKLVLGSNEQTKLILSRRFRLKHSHKGVFFSAGLLTCRENETPRTCPRIENATNQRRKRLENLQRPDSQTTSRPPLDQADPKDRTDTTVACVGVDKKSRMNSKLIFMYTNAQSVLSKLDELRILTHDLHPDVISITETCLSEQIDDRELMLPGFQLFRKDRQNRRGGGIVTFVKNGLYVSEKTAQLTCSTEALWLTIRAPGYQSLDILTVYRPPRNDPDADAQLLEELRLFSTRPTTLILGDFNAPHINWSSASADCSEAAFDQQLLRTSDNLLLTQHVMFPTRVREGQQMNCLDLVFTKYSDNIDVVNCLPPLSQSDHVVLMWEYTLFSLPAQPLDTRPNIWRGDFEQMRRELSPIDWASTLSGDVEEDWCQFKELVHNLISNHCPIMRRRLTNRPRWLTPSLKKEVNKKRKLWKRSLTDQTPEFLCIARYRKAFEKDLLNRARVNPKVLYSYTRQSTRNKDPIPLLRTAAVMEISDDK
nr:unnamed protein product [Spirometra erinaceieuropaei]